ncbi:NADPH--cytochrome P450 reductase 2 [Glycine soja]
MYHSLSQSLTRRHHTPQRPHRRLSSCSFLLENCDFLMLITTSVAVLIGCIVVFIWRRPSSPKVKPLEPPKHVIEKLPEIDVDDDIKKVTILFDTQTGTAKNALSLRKIRVGVKNNVAEPNSNSPWVVLGDMLGAPNNIIGAPKSIGEFGRKVTRGIGLASTTSDLSFMGLANGTGELSSTPNLLHNSLVELAIPSLHNSPVELAIPSLLNSPVQLASLMELKSRVVLARPVPHVTLSPNSPIPSTICMAFT